MLKVEILEDAASFSTCDGRYGIREIPESSGGEVTQSTADVDSGESGEEVREESASKQFIYM